MELDENNIKALNIIAISLIELGKIDNTLEKIRNGINFFGKMKKNYLHIFLEITRKNVIEI